MTVSQTKNLVNEMVHVSWTGFTPSGDVLYDPTIHRLPRHGGGVQLSSPAPPQASATGVTTEACKGAFGPFGPMNTAYATTAKNGTGQLDIQILTLAENQMLGLQRQAPLLAGRSCLRRAATR